MIPCIKTSCITSLSKEGKKRVLFFKKKIKRRLLSPLPSLLLPALPLALPLTSAGSSAFLLVGLLCAWQLSEILICLFLFVSHSPCDCLEGLGFITKICSFQWR